MFIIHVFIILYVFGLKISYSKYLECGQFNHKNLWNIKNVTQNMFNMNKYFIGSPLYCLREIWWPVRETGRFGLYPGASQIIWECLHRCLVLVVVYIHIYFTNPTWDITWHALQWFVAINLICFLLQGPWAFFVQWWSKES